MNSSPSTSLGSPVAPGVPRLQNRHWMVILASSLGTVFEWYDFYLYGTLAIFFGKLFFPPGNDTGAFLASLATFGAGFAVRPFGALVFGRVGDLVGRKYTFLVTIIVMGVSTAFVGVLPTFAQIGWGAPVILVALRLAQGLALGGEYGGAATYVAEHAPHGRRGFYTSWIQTTATLGLFLSLLVIFAVRRGMSADAFAQWGWRLPFFVSVVLLGFSIYIRLKLQESPVFAEMKAQGKGSRSPLTESFANWGNARIVLLALFGATAGQGVVWYAGQFYALYFLSNTLKVGYEQAYGLVALSLLLGTPFFVFFGWLSDRIGRKSIMLAGLLLAAVTYIPIFGALTRAVNPALDNAIKSAPVTLYTTDYRGGADLALGATRAAFLTIFGQATTTGADQSTDAARKYLNTRGIPFNLAPAKPDSPLVVEVGGNQAPGFNKDAIEGLLAPAGYPKAADPNQINWPLAIALLTVLVLYVTMVYGPIAAFLVELFPTRIRYTSMSLPYHIGNGWFGGFLPLIAASIVVFSGNIYSGLWYPIGVALLTFVVCLLFVRESKDNELRD